MRLALTVLIGIVIGCIRSEHGKAADMRTTGARVSRCFPAVSNRRMTIRFVSGWRRHR
jgi:hypothetical protein